MAFCPSCGAPAVDTFCAACLRRERPLVASVKPVTLVRCSTCDRYRMSGSWQGYRALRIFLTKHIRFDPEAYIADVHIPVPVLEHHEPEVTLPVRVEGSVSRMLDPYVEEYEIVLRISWEQCDRCALASSSYFEGVLQLRNPREEVVEYIERAIQHHPEVRITKASDVRGGIDFHLTDQKFLQQFVSDLRKQFGGEVKVQSRLHTYDRQTSKKVFRLTALLRLPSFWRGDIIETDKKLFLIARMGASLHGFDLRRRKPGALVCPRDADVVIREPVSVVVSTVRPKPMLLDPEDFQEVPLASPAPVVPGQTVRAVQDGRGRWYVAERLGE